MFAPSRVWQHSFMEIDHEIVDSRRVVVGFWRKNVHEYWLTT